ncbi:MAG: hypothetical protein B5M52_02640 [Helicobacteraceae bacterium 4484_230]|nr:MAG: hypothetical protein B5M52_02640 [Helicobacteraceae bacterium 4484_230]
MNTLSEQERIALEDVFMSISPTTEKRSFFFKFIDFINFSNNKKLFAKYMQMAKMSVNHVLQTHNKPIFPYLLHKSNEIKKNLS